MTGARTRPQTQRETRNKALNVKPRLDTKLLAYPRPQAKRKRKERLKTKLLTWSLDLIQSSKLEKLDSYKHTGLLWAFVNYSCKKFNKTDTWNEENREDDESGKAGSGSDDEVADVIVVAHDAHVLYNYRVTILNKTENT